jgi:pimeloyl-ACP methyl ester carboxylesterase
MTLFNMQNRSALKSAGFVESRVTTRAGMQTIFEKGSGPALVFLHGAGDQAGSWSKIAGQFGSKYHVIVLDLAGHGSSEPAEGPLHLATILDGIDGVLSAKVPNQRVTFVGNSLGAWMAIYYAYQHPEKVERVIAVDGGPIRGERPDLVELPRDREQASRMFDAVLDPGSPHPPGFVLDDIVRLSQDGPLHRLVEAGAPEMSNYLLDDKLSGLNTPVDLLWGESDRLVPIHYAERMLAEIPASRLTSIPRCGHVPQQECPKIFGEKLSSVLLEAPPQPRSSAAAEGKK